MIKKPSKVRLHRLHQLYKKPRKAQPELTNAYKVYAWVWLVLSVNWVLWVIQQVLSHTPNGDLSIAYALPGVMVAGLAGWLLKCKPERRRPLITGIGAFTTLFFIANIIIAFISLLFMAFALRSRKA